jgi:hypothetical protein
MIISSGLHVRGQMKKISYLAVMRLIRNDKCVYSLIMLL